MATRAKSQNTDKSRTSTKRDASTERRSSKRSPTKRVPVHSVGDEVPAPGMESPPTSAQIEQPSLIRIIVHRLEPMRTLAVAVTAILAACTALYGFWTWLDAPQLVTNRRLEATRLSVTKELHDTRDELRESMNSQLSAIAVKADRNRVDTLELSLRQAFASRTQLNDQILAVKDRLRKAPYDTILLQRLEELQNYKSYVDQQVVKIREQLHEMAVPSPDPLTASAKPTPPERPKELRPDE